MYVLYIIFIRVWFSVLIFILFFFFKQKTAYEMRISDWSSDVCSSDLGRPQTRHPDLAWRPLQRPCAGSDCQSCRTFVAATGLDWCLRRHRSLEIGRASCRERVCQYV